MKADSFAPPAFRGELRGCGKAECALAVDEVTDDAGGESMKPPEGCEAMMKEKKESKIEIGK